MSQLQKRSEIIKQLKKFFIVQELVCPHTYRKFGELSWQFFDTEFLYTLLVVRRDILNVPVYANNWDSGGSFSQRGFRCNVCQIPREKTESGKVYLSAHCNGAGVDFDAKGMTAEQVRNKIAANSHLLPYPIRLEKAVNWVHLDVYDPGNGKTINYFLG